jgi:hypothetical protein
MRRSESWIHGRDSSAGTARVQFSGISSFSFVLFSYVLVASLYVNVFAYSVHSVLMLRILYFVLLMYYCLHIVHCLCNTAAGHRPNCRFASIAVSLRH